MLKSFKPTAGVNIYVTTGRVWLQGGVRGGVQGVHVQYRVTLVTGPRGE